MTSVPSEWSLAALEGKEIMGKIDEIIELMRNHIISRGKKVDGKSTVTLHEPYFDQAFAKLYKLKEGHIKEICAANNLCQIYFEIAEDAIGAEEVRQRRNKKLKEPACKTCGGSGKKDNKIIYGNKVACYDEQD